MLFVGGRIVALWQHNEESPGFRGTKHQITSGWSNPRESATENFRQALLGKVEKVG